MDIGIGGPAALQANVVNSLGNWAKTWGMKFNPSKCIHISTDRFAPEFTLTLDGSPIPKSDKVKYFGLTFHKSLKWDEHINTVAKRANKSLGMLRRSLHGANSKTCMLAFNSVVRPILEYASQVWSPYTKTQAEDLEKIHRRAIRWAFRIPRLSSVSAIMTSNNIVPLSYRRDQLDERFLAKIQLGDYMVNLKEFITFNTCHNTRGNTINPHYSCNQFKFSYYNRMRTFVKVIPP